MATSLNTSPSLLLGDGKDIALTQGEDLILLPGAMITDWSIEIGCDYYDIADEDGSAKTRMIEDSTVRGNIGFVSMGEQSRQPNARKFMMQQAEKLTVRELLSVMHKKLEGRQ